MLVKDMPGCNGCPWREDGNKTFVPDEIRPNARVLIVGQNPGEAEAGGRRLVERAGKVKRWEPCAPAPFLGDSGYDLERTFLPLSGLVRKDVSLANTVRCRLGGTNKLPPLERSETRAAIQHCQRAYMLPRVPYVVALGEMALWATTGEDGGDPPPYEISRKIVGWRGWVLPWSPFVRQNWTRIWSPTSETDVRVFASLHPASLYEAPWLKPASLRDWQKLGELLRGIWPQPLPPIQRRIKAWPHEFAFDTEFYEVGRERRLTRWSASDGEQVWCVEKDEPLPPPPNEPPLVIMHQADADIDNLDRFFGGVEVIHEDTMYAHHSLHSELSHGLDFLGSLYARTNRWKHLVHTSPVTYAAADAYGTWDVWQALRGELARDPQTEWVYRNCLLPLLRVVAKARRMGIRVDSERARQAVQSLQDAQRVESLHARAASGWPMNLGSNAHVADMGVVEGWIRGG